MHDRGRWPSDAVAASSTWRGARSASEVVLAGYQSQGADDWFVAVASNLLAPLLRGASICSLSGVVDRRVGVEDVDDWLTDVSPGELPTGLRDLFAEVGAKGARRDCGAVSVATKVWVERSGALDRRCLINAAIVVRAAMARRPMPPFGTATWFQARWVSRVRDGTARHPTAYLVDGRVDATRRDPVLALMSHREVSGR